MSAVQDNNIPRTFDCVKVDDISDRKQKFKALHTRISLTLRHPLSVETYFKSTVFWHAVMKQKGGTHSHAHSDDNHTNAAASLLAGLLAGL